ncbi:hypothetical protein D3C78_1661950 [compost metagenome]
MEGHEAHALFIYQLVETRLEPLACLRVLNGIGLEKLGIENGQSVVDGGIGFPGTGRPKQNLIERCRRLRHGGAFPFLFDDLRAHRKPLQLGCKRQHILLATLPHQS